MRRRGPRGPRAPGQCHRTQTCPSIMHINYGVFAVSVCVCTRTHVPLVEDCNFGLGRDTGRTADRPDGRIDRHTDTDGLPTCVRALCYTSRCSPRVCVCTESFSWRPLTGAQARPYVSALSYLHAGCAMLAAAAAADACFLASVVVCFIIARVIYM